MALFVDRIPATPLTDDLQGNRTKAAERQKSLGKAPRYTAESQEGWLDRELDAMKTSQQINRKKTEQIDKLEDARKRTIQERTPRILKSGR